MTDSQSRTDRISKLLETEYNLKGKITRLAGENENYLVTTPDNSKFVFKLADDDTTQGMIEIEHLAVESMIEQGLELGLPRVVPTIKNRLQACLVLKDKIVLKGRLLEFVDGTAWCKALPPNQKQREDLGKTIALMNRAMESVIHPDYLRTHVWDLASAEQHCCKIAVITDPDRRMILEQIFLLYAAIFLPRFPKLAKGLIHGDINDDNVLVSRGRISGILDFGDCLKNPIVCDLAIAIAYHTLDEPDPLAAGADIVAAYHRIRPLSMDEIMVLYPLICTRLAVSVIIAALRRRIDPDRQSWFVSETRAWQKLEEFSNITPAEAAIILASKTDLDPYNDRGAAAQELSAQRRKLIAPSFSTAYDTPLKIIQGQGQYLFDYYGRPFLDLYNNVCHVGHCHPHVVAAGQQQMAKLNTNTRYLYDGLTQYAQKLCNTLPQGLDTCFFVNSGSEANELALRIARAHTGQKDILVVDNAYHGHTNAMIEISPYKFMGKGGKKKPEPWVHVVPVADGYRGKFKGQNAETGRAYGDEIKKIIQNIDRPIAGFITESLLSCGGQVIPPQDYFKTAFKHVRDAGGICITDEVQTGFGRVGEKFWAFELQDVVPDIVVMGKPIGNGHPMAALVTTKRLQPPFANGMEFFATFGGNPVSCAIGQAVLEVIQKEGLQQHAKKTGKTMLESLAAIQPKHRLMGDVRGIGLFMGIELVLNRTDLTPAPKQAQEMVNRLKQRGILLGTDGPLSNVIKIKPPMVMTANDARMFVQMFDDELTKLENL